MRITDRLLGDHKTFRKMLGDIDAIYKSAPGARDKNKLIRIAELFKDHLLLHAWFEDYFYYPVIAKELSRFENSGVTFAYVKHLEHEHKTIDGYMEQLEQQVKQSDPTWPQTFALFRLGLEAHMKSEEQILFPESERVLGEARLNDLSDEMEKHRSEAPKIRPHAK